MAYSTNGTIQAADINAFISTGTPNFNNVWSVGAGNSGYGQTALVPVVAGALISQNPWNSLVTNIAKAATHQGTTITAVVAPVTGDKINYILTLGSSLNSISTNRLNAAQQGGTTTSVATSTVTWSDKLTVTFTVTFSSNNSARYFFNAGGQIGINCSHPAGTGTTINTLISDLCSDAGTVWLSSPTSGTVSLSSTAYSGITKIGGANPGGATISTNSGFYAQTSTTTEVFKQFSDITYNTAYGSYGPGTFMNISTSYNGAGVLTVVVTYDEVPNGAVVSADTVTVLTVRSPSTTMLTNTWGTPTLSNVITAI